MLLHKCKGISLYNKHGALVHKHRQERRAKRMAYSVLLCSVHFCLFGDPKKIYIICLSSVRVIQNPYD